MCNAAVATATGQKASSAPTWLPHEQHERRQSTSAAVQSRAVGLLSLVPELSGVLGLLLIGAMVLTFWECRTHQLPFKQTAWWLSLTLLIHVPGYLALRLWLAFGSRPAEGTT